MDPVSAGVGKAIASATDAASAESAKVAGNLLTRLLGPVADEMGAALAEKYRTANVQRVVQKAAIKARLEEDGRIPPRVAAQVFDAAQWAENEFVAEYLSGVLAGARTADGVSDRGVTWTALVARLSSDALKLHLALYAATRDLVEGMSLDSIGDILSEWIWVDIDQVTQFAEFDSASSLIQSIYTLKAEDLIARSAQGEGKRIGAFLAPKRVIEGSGLLFQLSVRGISLYFEAFGLGERWVQDIALPDIADAVRLPDGLGPVPTAAWVTDLPLA